MDTPLGRTAGNAIEVMEAIDVLSGGGPADVIAVTVALAREMLELAGIKGVDPAAKLAAGEALPVWWDMVAAQGGPRSFELPEPAAGERVVNAPRSGYLTRLDALGRWRRGRGVSARDGPAKKTRCRRPRVCAGRPPSVTP